MSRTVPIRVARRDARNSTTPGQQPHDKSADSADPLPPNGRVGCHSPSSICASAGTPSIGGHSGSHTYYSAHGSPPSVRGQSPGTDGHSSHSSSATDSCDDLSVDESSGTSPEHVEKHSAPCSKPKLVTLSSLVDGSQREDEQLKTRNEWLLEWLVRNNVNSHPCQNKGRNPTRTAYHGGGNYFGVEDYRRLTAARPVLPPEHEPYVPPVADNFYSYYPSPYPDQPLTSPYFNCSTNYPAQTQVPPSNYPSYHQQTFTPLNPVPSGHQVPLNPVHSTRKVPATPVQVPPNPVQVPPNPAQVHTDPVAVNTPQPVPEVSQNDSVSDAMKFVSQNLSRNEEPRKQTPKEKKVAEKDNESGKVPPPVFDSQKVKRTYSKGLKTPRPNAAPISPDQVENRNIHSNASTSRKIEESRTVKSNEPKEKPGKMLSKYYEVQKTLQCDDCRQVFDSRFSLYTHSPCFTPSKLSLTCGGEVQLLYKCRYPRCGKLLKTKRTLWRHYCNCHHRDVFKCKICGRFKTKSLPAIRDHVIEHLSIEQKKSPKEKWQLPVCTLEPLDTSVMNKLLQDGHIKVGEVDIKSPELLIKCRRMSHDGRACRERFSNWKELCAHQREIHDRNWTFERTCNPLKETVGKEELQRYEDTINETVTKYCVDGVLDIAELEPEDSAPKKQKKRTSTEKMESVVAEESPRQERESSEVAATSSQQWNPHCESYPVHEPPPFVTTDPATALFDHREYFSQPDFGWQEGMFSQESPVSGQMRNNVQSNHATPQTTDIDRIIENLRENRNVTTVTGTQCQQPCCAHNYGGYGYGQLFPTEDSWSPPPTTCPSSNGLSSDSYYLHHSNSN